MKFIEILAALIVGYGLFLPAQGLADKLITGVWIGTYAKMDETEATVVDYIVQKKSDNQSQVEEYKITLYLYDEAFDFENLEITDEKLKFSLNLGETVKCLLSKENGLFKGLCFQEIDDDIKPCFKLTMQPPAEEYEESTDK